MHDFNWSTNRSIRPPKSMRTNGKQCSAKQRGNDVSAWQPRRIDWRGSLVMNGSRWSKVNRCPIHPTWLMELKVSKAIRKKGYMYLLLSLGCIAPAAAWIKKRYSRRPDGLVHIFLLGVGRRCATWHCVFADTASASFVGILPYYMYRIDLRGNNAHEQAATVSTIVQSKETQRPARPENLREGHPGVCYRVVQVMRCRYGGFSPP